MFERPFFQYSTILGTILLTAPHRIFKIRHLGIVDPSRTRRNGLGAQT